MTRGRVEREGEREKQHCERNMDWVASHMHPNRQSDLQPRNVSGLELRWQPSGVGGCSDQLSHLARAILLYFKINIETVDLPHLIFKKILPILTKPMPFVKSIIKIRLIF